MMRKQNRCVNDLKAIGCILVILNHFHGKGEFGNVIYAVSHIGVPIFFLISGFYLYQSSREETRNGLPSKIAHIVSLLVFHFCLYTFDFLYDAIIYNYYDRSKVIGSYASYFSMNALKRTIFWSSTFWGFAQWFLIALLEAYIVFWAVYKINAQEIILKYSIIIAALLFIVHIPVRIIAAKAGLLNIGSMSIFTSDIVRNAWLDAVPFMLVGIYVRCRMERGYEQPHTKTLLILGIGGVLEGILEYYVTDRVIVQQRISCVLYMGTVITVCSLFLFAVYHPEKGNKILGYIGEKLSLIVYFIHPIIGKHITRYFSRYDWAEQGFFQDFLPVVIIFITIICAFLLDKILQWIKGERGLSAFGVLVSTIAFTSIVFSVLPIENKSWTMLARVYTNDFHESETVTIDNITNYTELEMTVQDENSYTINTQVIPIGQFINGAVYVSVYVPGDDYNITDICCKYVSNTSVSVEKMAGDNYKNREYQIRLWAK